MSSNGTDSLIPWDTLLASCCAATFAESMTIPLDTTKVRMQLHPEEYSSFSQTIKVITKEEGFLSLYGGLSGALMRQTILGTSRMTFYDIGRQMLVDKKGEENITLINKICLGMVSGSMTICIANPADTIKVRFQMDSPSEPRYSGLFDAGKQILKEEGIRGFYQSLPTNIGRSSIMNAAELASYDQIKSSLLYSGTMTRGIPLYALSSLGAGLIAVIISSPLDILKSTIIDGELQEDGSKKPFKSVKHAIKSIYQRQGIPSFYKGFLTNCKKVMIWNMIMFMTKETLLEFLIDSDNK